MPGPQRQSSAHPIAGPFDPFLWGLGVRIAGERPGLFSTALWLKDGSNWVTPERNEVPPSVVCNSALPELSYYALDYRSPGARAAFHATERWAVIQPDAQHEWAYLFFHRPPDSGMSLNLPAEGGLVLDGAGYGEIRARILKGHGKGRPGVVHPREASSGRALGGGFGLFPGDTVSFAFDTPGAWPDCPVVMRYHLSRPGLFVRLTIDDKAVFEGELPVTSRHEAVKFDWYELGRLNLAPGRHILRLEAAHSARLPLSASFMLDCVYLSPFLNPTKQEACSFPQEVVLYGEHDTIFMERITPGTPTVAGLRTQGRIRLTDVAQALSEFDPENRGALGPANAPCAAVVLEPGAGLFAAWGQNRAEVNERLQEAGDTGIPEDLSGRASSIPGALPAAPACEIRAADITAASLLSGVVYPVPGSLSEVPFFRTGIDLLPLQAEGGWQAAALVPVDMSRALEAVSLILPRADEMGPLFQNGPSIPTQVFAVWEVFQQTGDVRVLKAFYPGLFRQFSDLAQNEREGFPAWTFRFSGNPLGERYPPAAHVAEKAPYPEYSSPATLGLLSAAAGLLETAAGLLGHSEEAALFAGACSHFTRLLTEEMYDEDAGYFSYIDEWKREHLRDRQGGNLNLGLEGVLPIGSGRLPLRIEEHLLDHLFDEQHLWRGFGFGSISRSASCYREEDDLIRPAWQWFLFKYLLWKGEAAKALNLARAFATAWLSAVAGCGYLPEALMPDRSPVGCAVGGSGLGLLFFSSLRLWGFVTAGLFTVLRDIERSERRLSFSVTEAHPHRQSSILVCLPDGNYRVRAGDEEGLAEAVDGVLVLIMQSGPEPTPVVITPL